MKGFLDRFFGRKSDEARSAQEHPRALRAFVSIDCETTGLDPFSGDRIVSFGAVKSRSIGYFEETLHYIFDPERPSHPKAAAVHGYSRSILSKQEKFSHRAQEIRNWIGDAVVVGHNVQFDLNFLNMEFERCGIPRLQNHAVCTMQMWREQKPGYRASLDAVCSYLGFSEKIARKKHDALQDAALALAAYHYLRFKQKEVQLIGEASVPQNFIAAVKSRNQKSRELTPAQAQEAYLTHGSYSAAARAVGVSATTIKNRIAQLEGKV